MKIPTIDEQYEYRMGLIVKKALAAQEKTIDDFDTMDDMWDFLWNSAEDFGQKVMEDMTEWVDDETWAAVDIMARTREQTKLTERKDKAYRFCKELAGLADLPKTAGGFDKLLRMIDDGAGCFEFVFTWEGMAASKTTVRLSKIDTV